ncbi:hypothetical protein NUKP99_37700 [Klebsiella variicola]|nr:hypothetical protein NUKP99_37700 [Klebsiella variicola]
MVAPIVGRGLAAWIKVSAEHESLFCSIHRSGSVTGQGAMLAISDLMPEIMMEMYFRSEKRAVTPFYIFSAITFTLSVA